MRLKKMEITGFKSFVEKVGIDFPPGVSAIVGPNGCGKSNIVDALRWAMGEQSVKQLRGKSMEDVIFAGTDGRPPLNMAEVSLVLANDGQGPGPEVLKDFTEVMITRRLYRSGESAYLLNRLPCRLKDIQNIFLGSGMGAKSYAVIGQGNIGAITDAGPDERRFFIEEAAGITRYKSRKAETLRKLEATNANLDRVNDIVAEVARQLNGLQRQAIKAERYKTLQARIRVLDLNLSIRRHDALSAGIREAEGELRKLKDAEGTQTAAIRRLEADIEGIKLARHRKNQEISQRKSDRFDTQRSIDKTENDLAHLREEIGRLADEVGELKKGRETLEEKNRTLADEMAQVSEETGRLEKETADVQAEFDREEAETRGLKDAQESAGRELTARKAALDDLLQKETRRRAALDNALENKETLERRRKRADEETLQAQREANERERREAAAQEALTQCREAVKILDVRLAGLSETLESRRRELADGTRRAQALELERDKRQSRHAALKKMADAYEWYREGVKAVMTRNEGRPAEGVLGLAADILEPAPGYETAVEAVLGETLQYVLVEKPAAGRDAVAFLRSENRGRSGFIPVSSIRPVNGGQKTDKNRVGAKNLSPLLDHVQVRDGYETIGQSLLGHVRVADDLAGAMALARDEDAPQTVATLDGDVITAQGVLVGGSPETLSGILAKKQELKALAREITDLDEALDKERQAQAALEERLAGLTEERKTLSGDRQVAVEDELAAQKSVYAATEALKQARRHLESVQGEAVRILDEADELDETVQRSREALTDLAEEAATARSEVARKEAEAAALSERLSAYNDRTVDLRMRLTALKGQLDNSRDALNRLREFREDGLARLEGLKRDIDLKEKRRESADEKIAAESHGLTVMYANLEHLNTALEKSEAEFFAIDGDLKKKDAAVAESRRGREEIQEAVRSLEMEQSQRRMKADNIESRLAERYHGDLSGLRAEMVESGAMAEAADDAAMTEELTECRKKIAAIGDVNMGAIREYTELKERHDFLLAQQADLVQAVDDLHQVIQQINQISQEKFLATFDQVNEKLNEVFPRLFDGGSARLELTEPDKPLETGVEFMVHPPGKKLTRLSLLSGGEKALAAIAFVFSIFLIKPASFCIMDEIDAPLDEANVYRFNELLRIIGEQSQIVMITHKKKSMEFADTLFGITMEKKGISKVVSVNLEGR